MAANDSVVSRKIRAKDVFEEYFLTHHEEDLVVIFEAEEEDLHYPVYVNFLSLFETHVEVAESLLSCPSRLLPVLDTGLLTAARKLLERLGGEAPGRTLKINLHARIIGVPSCPELQRCRVPRTSDVGRLLCVTGTVVRTTSPKMLVFQKDFMCLKCKHVFPVSADHDQYYQMARPSRCPNPDSCPATALVPLPSPRPLHTKDYQEIKIQEQVQKLVVGSIPRSIWVTLEDDLVDACQPGDDVLICGSVHRRWRGTARDVRPDIDLVVKANNVKVRNKQRSGAVVTDEMREEFNEFWHRHRHHPMTGRNIILASLCPQIYGLYVVKLAVAVVVAGGVQRSDNTSTRIRGESHLLLVGDPGTGKSQFLKYVCQLEPRCVLTTGVGTTNAGLTVACVREEGEWALEAGALVLADGGICCIDEFSSVREADRAAIHEAMEQQTISVAKAGIVCKLNSRCTVMAATNPKGEYDPEESLMVNTALASPLLSRFDLILVLLDMKNHEWDKVVSDYILNGRDPLSGDGGGPEDWNLEKLQAYMCHIRSLQPCMTPQANSILSRYYQLQRQSSHSNQSRTTIRLLESLVRLSQGHARLMMRGTVEVQDAVAAVSLMESSMSGAAVITAVNPLHTAFPQDPSVEYKTQARVVLEKLGLLDILTTEMTRLNEEQKLWAAQQPDSPTAPQPPPPHTIASNEDRTPVTQFQQRSEFRPTMREEAGAGCRIEELEEVLRTRGDRGKQKTLPEMSRRREKGVKDSQKPSSSKDPMVKDSQKPSTSKGSEPEKGRKRKQGDSSRERCDAETDDIEPCSKKSKTRKTKRKDNNEGEGLLTSSPHSSQELVDRAGEKLLEDLDDFEDGAVSRFTFSGKDKVPASVSNFVSKRKAKVRSEGNDEAVGKDAVPKKAWIGMEDEDSVNVADDLCRSSKKDKRSKIKNKRKPNKNTEETRSGDPPYHDSPSKDLGWLQKFSYKKPTSKIKCTERGKASTGGVIETELEMHTETESSPNIMNSSTLMNQGKRVRGNRNAAIRATCTKKQDPGTLHQGSTGRKLEDSRGDGDKQPIDSRGDGDKQPIDSRGDGDKQPIDSRGDGDKQPIDSRGDGDKQPIDSRRDGERKTVDSSGGKGELGASGTTPSSFISAKLKKFACTAVDRSDSPHGPQSQEVIKNTSQGANKSHAAVSNSSGNTGLRNNKENSATSKYMEEDRSSSQILDSVTNFDLGNLDEDADFFEEKSDYTSVGNSVLPDGAHPQEKISRILKAIGKNHTTVSKSSNGASTDIRNLENKFNLNKSNQAKQKSSDNPSYENNFGLENLDEEADFFAETSYFSRSNSQAQIMPDQNCSPTFETGMNRLNSRVECDVNTENPMTSLDHLSGDKNMAVNQGSTGTHEDSASKKLKRFSFSFAASRNSAGNPHEPFSKKGNHSVQENAEATKTFNANAGMDCRLSELNSKRSIETDSRNDINSQRFEETYSEKDMKNKSNIESNSKKNNEPDSENNMNPYSSKHSSPALESSGSQKSLLGGIKLPFKRPTFSQSPTLPNSLKLHPTDKFQNEDLDDIDFDL